MADISINYAVIQRLIREKISVSTMESCTGGLLASVITDCSGASDIFPGGFVTYCNGAKEKCGVSCHIIEKYGVYSEETAKEMARACSDYYKTKLGIGITGTLGRLDPENMDSVSGQVFFAVKYGEKYISCRIEVPESLKERNQMKKFVVNEVLEAVLGIFA